MVRSPAILAMVGRIPRNLGTLFLLCLTACVFEPATQITGQWGGSGASLDARAPNVQLDFQCMRAVTSEVPVDGSGRFEGTAQVTAVSWAGPAPTVLRLSGRVVDNVMQLSVASVWPPNGGQVDTITTNQSFTLQRGAPPDFSGFGCLA
jgi:hypothetical protein